MSDPKRVAIIGHVDGGKSSLTAAITRILAEHPQPEYEVYQRNCAHVDCPAHIRCGCTYHTEGDKIFRTEPEGVE